MIFEGTTSAILWFPHSQSDYREGRVLFRAPGERPFAAAFLAGALVLRARVVEDDFAFAVVRGFAFSVAALLVAFPADRVVVDLAVLIDLAGLAGFFTVFVTGSASLRSTGVDSRLAGIDFVSGSTFFSLNAGVGSRLLTGAGFISGSTFFSPGTEAPYFDNNRLILSALTCSELTGIPPVCPDSSSCR